MFVPVKTTDGRLIPWEYIPAHEGEYLAGELLTVENGMVKSLEKCSAEMPCYLCMMDVSASSGKVVPCTRIDSRIVYETTLCVGVDGLRPGNKMIVVNGQFVRPGNGSFEVMEIYGENIGDTVRGRFVFEKDHFPDHTKKVDAQQNPLQYIFDTFGRDEILAQAAEEATELAQALLKLRRAYRGTTPVSVEDALEQVREEHNDLTLCMDVLLSCNDEPIGDTGVIRYEKLERWVERAQEYEKRVDRTANQ